MSRGLATVGRRLGFARFSGLYIWAGFIVLFAILTPDTFLTTKTLTSVASQQAITGLLAIGALIPLAAGVFDLSAAQNLGLSCVGSGWLMTHMHASPLVACVVTVAFGALVGAANGFLVSGVGINTFITTLGMTSVLLAIVEGVANGAFFGPFPTSFADVTSASPLGIPIIVVYLLVTAVLAWYMLEHTPVGRRLHACGANPEAAKLAGVPVGRYVFMSFVVCGVIASVAGILLASQLGAVSQTIGPSYLLPAYAAAFLGTTQLKPERINVWGTMIALYLLATGVEGLQLVGAQLWVTDLFNGVALLGAVSVAIVATRRRAHRETIAGEPPGGASHAPEPSVAGPSTLGLETAEAKGDPERPGTVR